MKKILLVAAVAVLVSAGCEKTQIINPMHDSIAFNTGMGKLTKASGNASDADSLGNANLQAQDFRIWAYADYEDVNTSTMELDKIYDNMANMNVYYDATTKKWAPQKEYYWPGQDKNLRFFAVSGVDLGGDLSTTDKIEIEITRTTTGEGESAVSTVAPTLTVKDFIVDSLSPNADLMVADFVCQNQSDKIVNLDFRHALTKVEFLFKTLENPDAAVYVQSLSVNGVYTKSTLTVSENTDASTNATKPMNFQWGTRELPKVFTDDYIKVESTFPDTIELISGTMTSEPDKTAMKLTTKDENFCTWLVMPQDITNLQVKVLYVMGTRQFESIFDLAVPNKLQAWGVNQYVRYNVTLAPNKISFNTSVDEWNRYDADSQKEGNQDIEYQN